MAEVTIISPDYFKLDGVSSETVGLYVDTPPIPPLAQQRYTTWETGIDMDYATPDDVYENIELAFSCFLFFKSSDFSLAELYAFLQGKSTLQFSRFPDRHFKIRQLKGVTPIGNYDGNKIALEIAFECAPFKYHDSNSEVSPSSGKLENPGTRYSRPIYKITHSGACSIVVNGETLEISASASSPLYVDAQRMIAYNESGENETKYTTGNYPFLQPGVNNVLTYGAAVTVIGNWRDY